MASAAALACGLVREHIAHTNKYEAKRAQRISQMHCARFDVQTEAIQPPFVFTA